MRSLRFVMALCAISVIAAGCNSTDVTTKVGGVAGATPAKCNNGQDDDGDSLIDYPADPGCVNLLDDTEENGTGSAPPAVVNNKPGDFNLFGTCVGSKARLSWSPSDRADGYFIERRLWTTG